MKSLGNRAAGLWVDDSGFSGEEHMANRGRRGLRLAFFVLVLVGCGSKGQKADATFTGHWSGGVSPRQFRMAIVEYSGSLFWEVTDLVLNEAGVELKVPCSSYAGEYPVVWAGAQAPVYPEQVLNLSSTGEAELKWNLPDSLQQLIDGPYRRLHRGLAIVGQVNMRFSGSLKRSSETMQVRLVFDYFDTQSGNVLSSDVFEGALARSACSDQPLQ